MIGKLVRHNKIDTTSHWRVRRCDSLGSRPKNPNATKGKQCLT